MAGTHVILGEGIGLVLYEELADAHMAVPCSPVKWSGSRLPARRLSLGSQYMEAYPIPEVDICLCIDERDTYIPVTTLTCPVKCSAAILWNTCIHWSTHSLQMTNDAIHVPSLGNGDR